MMNDLLDQQVNSSCQLFAGTEEKLPHSGQLLCFFGPAEGDFFVRHDALEVFGADDDGPVEVSGVKGEFPVAGKEVRIHDERQTFVKAHGRDGSENTSGKIHDFVGTGKAGAPRAEVDGYFGKICLHVSGKHGKHVAVDAVSFCMQHERFCTLTEFRAADFGYGLGGFASGSVFQRAESGAARCKKFNEFFKDIVYHFGLLLCRYPFEIRS
jgi:hypothetical protein